MSPMRRTRGQAGMSRRAARRQAARRPAGTSESAQRPGSRPELAPPCAKQVVFGRLVDRPGRERTHDARDVEEVPVVQVVREAIATPGTATHRQRKWQCVVEAASGCETVRLVDDDTADGQ